MKRAAALLILLAFVVPACGKKGPPRPPLRLLPAAAGDLSVVRRGADVHLQMSVPSANQSGEGRLDLARLEIYAITVGARAPEPPNRDLLTKRFLVGTIEVKPLPPPNEEQPPSQSKPQPQQPAAEAADTRPAPGAPATFVETLTKEKLEPVTLESVVKAPPAPRTTTVTPLAVTAGFPVPAHAKRIYVVRGVTRGGRYGAPSTRLQVPLAAPPPPPSAPQVTYTEQALSVTWAAPVVDAVIPPALGFRVYSRGAFASLNTSPLSTTAFERKGVDFGTEECFVVRTVQAIGSVSIESEPSEAVCVTPADTFAPAAPKIPSAVSGAGVINLIWDANTEPDLAGYLVLRGEAPGDTLQPLTPNPIRETSFRDTTVKPGVRYVYAVVAVDRSSPPNRSAESPRVEETAR